MKQWYEIYKERMNSRYLKHVKTKYKPFIDRVKESNACHYIELGCGAGFITRVLREYAVYQNFTLLDNCPKMLSLAMENNPTQNCTFVCADIRQQQHIPARGNPAVVHSHGVLEHFHDAEIVRILDNANIYAPHQVHFVPSSKYKTPSRGDERLMTVEQWEAILQQCKHSTNFQVTTFNDDYDIMIATGGQIATV